jgi:hypothetical protein
MIDKRIRHVIVFKNGNVAVCDADGQQIPEYQCRAGRRGTLPRGSAWFRVSASTHASSGHGTSRTIAETRVSVAADSTTEWQHDLGQGRQIVMERSSAGYRATLVGFCGLGSTPKIALDDLLVGMRHYCEAAADFNRDLAPGGQLHEKLRQISVLVDQIVENRGNEDHRGR